MDKVHTGKIDVINESSFLKCSVTGTVMDRLKGRILNVFFFFFRYNYNDDFLYVHKNLIQL